LKSPVDSGLGAFCILGFYVTILRKIPAATGSLSVPTESILSFALIAYVEPSQRLCGVVGRQAGAGGW
jgi:hypothetical protein